MAPSETPRDELESFLAPLHFDLEKAFELSRLFLDNFRELAATSKTQFLPTPISDSILRPIRNSTQGR